MALLSSVQLGCARRVVYVHKGETYERGGCRGFIALGDSTPVSIHRPLCARDLPFILDLSGLPRAQRAEAARLLCGPEASASGFQKFFRTLTLPQRRSLITAFEARSYYFDLDGCDDDWGPFTYP